MQNPERPARPGASPAEAPRRTRRSLRALTLFACLAIGHAASAAQEQASSADALRERIITIGREQVDDAAFRRDVERLIGVDIEPTALLDRVKGTISNPWVIFGFAAQGIFMMRFVVQWIASERRKRSYVPIAFWWLSLAGGISLMAYAFHRRDPVFLFGQALGCVIYLRNLFLIYRRAEAHRQTLEDRQARVSAAGAAGPRRPTDVEAPCEVTSG